MIKSKLEIIMNIPGRLWCVLLFLCLTFSAYAFFDKNFPHVDDKNTRIISDSNELGAIIKRQIKEKADLIIHSDRGSQYTAKSFRKLLKQIRAQQSMSPKGDCYANAHAESLWATLKAEAFSGEPRTLNEAKMLLFDYIETFYNPNEVTAHLLFKVLLTLKNAPVKQLKNIFGFCPIFCDPPRELCLSLARQGANVVCYVLSASEEDVRSARCGGVSLLVPHDHSEPGELSLLEKPVLPERFYPDIIIGHDRITGNYANLLVRSHFPDSKKVLFIHTAPEEIEWYKEKEVKVQTTDAAERKRVQLDIAKQCDLVVAVGPHLCDEFSTDLRGIGSRVPIHEFIPGLFAMSEEKNMEPPASIRCLILGRAEDYNLKGLGLAAKALGAVASRWKGDSTLKLVVRGVPVDSEKQLIQKLKKDCGTDNLDIIIRHYTSNENDLICDLRESSLLLMPSLKEGFGLVGLEAISCGIPILISEKSGLAQTLKRYIPDRVDASVCVLPVTGEKCQEIWIKQLEFALSSYPKRGLAFMHARQIRDELRQKISWSESTKLLIDKFHAILNICKHQIEHLP